MSGLVCEGLGVCLGRRAVLDDVDLALEAGRVTAVLGPNGAGKSTLLSCLAGLRIPDAGRVVLDGAALTDLRPRARARSIAVLPQTPEIAWAVEVRTLVALGRTPFLGARGLTKDDEAAVERAMAVAEVQDFAGRIVNTLSGGERARVLIARALAGEPEWLLADEPFAGLDPAHQLDVATLLRRLARAGTGVVVTLHDLTLASRVADRVVLLAQGAIVADGPPRDVLIPETLRRAYGVEAVMRDGMDGPLIEILGRA